MKSFKEFLAYAGRLNERDEYRGEHEAPGPGSGAPLHDLKGVYPDDFHHAEGAKHYGSGESYDHESHSIISSLKGRPNASVKIYRAVPHEPTHEEKLNSAYDAQKHYMKTGKLKNIGHGVDNYDKLHDHIKHLESQTPTETPKKSIKGGDWVSVSKQYAHDHGKTSLKGKYKVLSKTVKAKEVYTSGDSIHEQGYHPSK